MYMASGKFINEIEANYCLKNRSNLPIVTDCNSDPYIFASYDRNTLNTPYTEGSSTSTEGMIISMKRGATTWNTQIAVINGYVANATVWIRTIAGAGTSWSVWRAVM